MNWVFPIFVILPAIYTPTPGGEEPYFPERVFDQEDKKSNDDTAKWYTSYLHEMGEPSLWKLSKDDHAATVYRLLWLPSFHSPISVRIVKSGKSIVLHVVRLDVSDGKKPGKVSFRQTKKLTDDEWAWLQIHLERAQYWKMNTRVEMNLNEGLTLDGDHLVCEGARDGKYHVVDRSDPNPSYEKLCRFILDLSGLDVKAAWSEYHEKER